MDSSVEKYREERIARLSRAQLSARQIAQRLGLSLFYVRTVLKELLAEQEAKA